MNLPSVVLAFANIGFFLANIPQMRSVWKNFRGLKGYDFNGSSLITISSYLVLLYLGLIGEWVSFFLSVTTSLYWTMVVISLVKYGEAE